MIAEVKDQSGTKTLKPISGAIPTGNPVGTLLTTYKKIQPRNYLYCDGSTFNAGQYPALYLYLGSNVLPDYRECTMVGAEQNTTDTIATHDVYAQGEFKDDQIQNITGSIATGHSLALFSSGTGGAGEGAIRRNSITNPTRSGAEGSGYCTGFDFDASRVARAGTTTHSKQKAVYVYIKAVDGVDISDEDTFLDTVKNFVQEKNSYSTTEMLTGGKWIDGKPIYRRVITINVTTFGDSYITLANDTWVGNIDSIVNGGVCMNKIFYDNAGRYWKNNTTLSFNYGKTFNLGSSQPCDFIVEYTKTTD